MVDSHQFPLIKGVFTDFDIQCHIHDMIIIMQEGSHLHKFRLFFKNHCRIKLNTTVAALGRDRRCWRGDIVVMRAGKVVDNSVVNMRGKDSRWADFIVKQ